MDKLPSSKKFTGQKQDKVTCDDGNAPPQPRRMLEPDRSAALLLRLAVPAVVTGKGALNCCAPGEKNLPSQAVPPPPPWGLLPPKQEPERQGSRSRGT
ncbi:hypothetical protein NL676_006256 [Syzygium grande]|nr:hypothetical protein NL676_006256 [Syzygium grande]